MTDQSYYPSARVRLIVRFEDYGNAPTPEPPKRPPQLRRGKKESKSSTDLKVVQQDGRFLLVGPGDDPNQVGTPQQQTSSADSLTHVIDGIVPQTAKHLRNSIRQADTLDLELDFDDLPIDSRVVRACAVEYYLGCVSSDDFSRGMNGEFRTDAVPSGLPMLYSIVPDEYTDRHGRPRSNLRFQGWVDEWEVGFSSDDAPIVSLQCTDNTRLVIEQEAPPKLTIGSDAPVDEAIANYLAAFPQFRGLSVEYRPAVPRDQVPVLKNVLARTAFQPKLGPTPAAGGTSKLTVWDYITDVCGAIGHTVRMEFSTIVVQRARTLYAAQFPGRPDDPFTGRVLPGGREIDRRLMVYGSDLQDLSIRKRFTKFAPINIEVRCYDPGRKKTLVVRYPQKNDRVKRLAPGNAAEQKYEVIRVTGIQDEKVLRLVAQSAYETIGRNELEVCFATKNLGSFGGDNLDPDLLDCLAGDAIDVEVRTNEEDEGTVFDIARQVAARPAEFLREKGFPEGFARAYAQAVDAIGFPTTFRMRTLSMEWEKGEGVGLDFESVNYIEVRADKELPEGEELGIEVIENDQPERVVVKDEVEP